MGRMQAAEIRGHIWLLPQREAADLPTASRAVGFGHILPVFQTNVLPSLRAARRSLRVYGVVEDTREGVVDVADHVVQLVLSLQSERVGGLVGVYDDLHVHES